MTRSWLMAGALLLLGGSGTSAASRPTWTIGTKHLNTTWTAGMLTALRVGDEELVQPPADWPAVTGLRRLNPPALWNPTAQVAADRSGEALVLQLTWPEEPGTQVTLSVQPEPETGDLLVTQAGTSARPGVSGVQWGLGNVPDSYEVLVPGYSGLRFGADAPLGEQRFDYPLGWEAQFALIQGQRGGVLIWAEDTDCTFKALHLNHTPPSPPFARRGEGRDGSLPLPRGGEGGSYQPGAFQLGFETQPLAPFEEQSQVRSVRWRIHAYEGHWLVGANHYRAWAEEAFGLIPLEEQQPAWVRDIGFVVIVPIQLELLDELAQRVEPSQTLLYVPGWRRDGYDRNYPDYTALPEFGEWIAKAKGLGFRVMPHVNYFGCDPKNPLYDRFKQWQLTDPISKELLWWTWDRADPPIKFAYINPASREWRELFVQRMVDLCQQYPIDALHLDQTLCIWNHAHGRVDGLNGMEGNLALHRELRAALPEVALSGEGLNEITFRHEAFAQRHVYGLNHVDQTWDPRLLDMAHPVSSALLTPFTTIYGYLGMANPVQARDVYHAWRRAYDHFGVIPTLAHTNAEELRHPTPELLNLLEEARFFQQQRPRPDFTPPWAAETLLAYRLADGAAAAYVRDGVGVALQSGDHKWARRIQGVAEVALPGTIPNWLLYDEQRLFGLDPQRVYAYREEPRDPEAFHVSRLAEGLTLAQAGLRPELARLEVVDQRAVVAELWAFTGSARCGYELANGARKVFEGPRLHVEATGASIQPENRALFIHPPWKVPPEAQAANVDWKKGIGVSFAEFDVTLPDVGEITLQTGVALREGAVGKSDGVTFRVTAKVGEETRATEIHHDGALPQELRLDLSEFRGRDVTVHLETHPGEAGDPSFDWALFVEPRIRVHHVRTERLELVCPAEPKQVLAAHGQATLEPLGNRRYALEAPLPNTLHLFFAEPLTVQPPLNLWEAPFSSVVVGPDGLETPPHSFMGGRVGEAACGGETKPGLFAHPPQNGQTRVDYLLTLPPEPLRFTGFYGICDGSVSKGVGFLVQVNSQTLFEQTLLPDTGWQPVEVDLTPFVGQSVLFSLVTDARGGYDYDWAVWGEPRLERR